MNFHPCRRASVGLSGPNKKDNRRHNLQGVAHKPAAFCRVKVAKADDELRLDALSEQYCALLGVCRAFVLRVRRHIHRKIRCHAQLSIARNTVLDTYHAGSHVPTRNRTVMRNRSGKMPLVHARVLVVIASLTRAIGNQGEWRRRSIWVRASR